MSESFSRNIRLSSIPSLFSPYPANKINFTRFTWLDLVPRSIFFQFLSPAPVFFLFILILELLDMDKKDYFGSILLPFLVLIFINLLKNVIILRAELREEKKINEALVDVWNGKNFELTKSEKLVVGNFVKVLEGQKCPADLLVVFSSSIDGGFCCDLGEVTARTEFDRKMSVFETQQIFKGGVEESIKEKMIGKIYFTDPSPNYSEFSGKMSLMKNPKYIDLRFKNLLLMSSRLSGVSFIIGIILYAGYETKAFSSIQKQSKKRNFLQVKLKNFLFFYILLYLFLTTSLSVMSTNSNSHSSVTSFFLTFRECLILFSSMIPISMFILYEFILLFYKLTIESCSINNMDILENLKALKYIVTSSTGAITENKYEVTLSIVYSKLYRKSVNYLTVSDLDQANSDFSLFHDIDQDFTDLHEDLSNEKTQEFFKCLLLCNLKTNSKKSLTRSNDDQAINSFGKDIGAYVYSLNPHSVILNIADQIIACSIILTNKGKNIRTIIENNDENWTLYVRGTEKKLLNKLEIDPHIKDQIFPKIEKFKIKGLAFLVLGKKNLNSKEISWIKEEINNAESFPEQKEKRLEKVFQKLEKSCKFLGICGVEDSVKPETVQAVHSIKKTGTRLWVASSDKKTATFSACLKSGIIDDGSSIIFMRRVESYSLCLRVLADAILKNVYLEESCGELDDLNVFENKFSVHLDVASEINSTVKVSRSINSYNLIYEDHFNSNIRALEERVMQKIEEPASVLKNEFSVFVDRVSFRTALSNPNTVKLLICLLFSAKSVCFYKLTNKDKQDIIQMMKENLSFKPFVGAVGSRLEDIPMMQSADIGFYMKKSLSEELSYHDIKFSSFHDLKELIHSTGPSISKKISMFFHLFLYKNILACTVIFAYMTRCEYSLNSFYSICFKICLNSWVTLPLLVMILEYLEDRKSFIHQNFSVFWFSDLNTMSVFILLLNTFIDCLTIFVFLLIFNDDIILNASGKTDNSEILFFRLFITIILTFWVEVMRNVSIFTPLLISSLMISLSALILFSVLYEISTISDYHGIYNHLLSSPLCLVQLAMVPLTTLVLKTVAHLLIFSLINLKNKVFVKAKQSKLTTIYKHQIKSIKIVKDLYETNKYSLKFMISYIENVYQLNFIQSNIKVMRVLISVITILNCLWAVIDPLISMKSLELLIVNAVFSILMILLSLIAFTSFFKTYYVKVILFFIFVGILFKLVIEIMSKNISLMLTGIMPSIIYIFFNVDFLKVSVLNALGIVEYLIVEYLSSPEVYNNLKISEILTKIVIINVSSAFLARAIETTYREEYKLIKIQEQNYEKTQRILSVMLPEFVRKRVKDGVRYIAEDQGTVSIIFCDIDNFDMICAEYTPSELISFLDSFFQKLDTLCKIHGISKIETVGKTYMACSGLKDSESEMDGSVKMIHHTKRSISFSLAVIEEAERFLMKNKRKLEVKIGINSGPVTAGVVGYHKPQFSLVGDTVNTASRMCSTLKSKNAIQISSNTFHMIPDVTNLKFTSSTIFAKGKGEMNTFVVIPGFNEPTGTFDDAISNKTASAITGTGYHYETKLANENLSLLEMNFRTATLFYKNSECCSFQVLESEKDKKIRINKMESNKDIQTPIFLTCLVNYLVEISRSIYGMHFGEKGDDLSFIMRCCCFCLIVLLILVFKKVYLRRFYSLIILFLVFFLLSTSSIEEIRMKEKVGEESLEILDHMFIYLILIYCSGFSSRSLIFLFPVLIFPNLYIQSSRKVTYNRVFDLIVLTVFYFVNTSAIFNRETQIVNYTQLKTATEKDLLKTEDLLKQMMPAHVVENMKNHKTLTEKVHNVTLLYSDIVGFTEWSSKKSPKEIVNVLSEIFSRFDRLCLRHNVYKVHTIGDCYVVLGNLDFSQRNPGLECLNVVQMALAMIEVMKEVNLELAVNLNIRIGIHSGSMIAGIVGTDVVRYDIYGPDVLVANQMESNGSPGRINVSDATRELLLNMEARFNFVFNKELNFVTINKKIRTFLLSKE